MKLPIRKEYFDKIKAGEKDVEYRDAHITFVCIETGEKLRKEIESAYIIEDEWMLEDVIEPLKKSGVITEKYILALKLLP